MRSSARVKSTTAPPSTTVAIVTLVSDRMGEHEHR